jgi:hypothetical protein
MQKALVNCHHQVVVEDYWLPFQLWRPEGSHFSALQDTKKSNINGFDKPPTSHVV